MKYCFLLFLAAAIAFADTPRLLVLKNGTTYHSVVVLKVHPLVLNIKAEEGLFQIKKTDLPADWALLYPVDKAGALVEARDEAKTAQQVQQEEQKRLARAQAEAKERIAEKERDALFMGCRILSFRELEAGIADVELRNENDNPTLINGASIMCRVTDGRVFEGVWVTRSSSGQFKILKQATLAGNSSAHSLMWFFRDPEGKIDQIYWKQTSLPPNFVRPPVAAHGRIPLPSQAQRDELAKAPL